MLVTSGLLIKPSTLIDKIMKYFLLVSYHCRYISILDIRKQIVAQN